MAFADDLRSFLENRLLAFDSSIDLSPDSPAQVQVIDPTIARFGEDPFSTDIPTFIKDRLLQEFPDLAVDNGGLLNDILSKPLQLLLEPFKREIELIKLNQTVTNASLMSDDEADALGANWFETREGGNNAGGSVRLYFSAPTTQRVTPEKRVFTNSGLSFFPVESFFITSAQMLFNRQGNLYFMDIVVRADTPGTEFNVNKGDIVGIEDVAGVVKVANLSDFTDGSPRESNENYIARLDTALTERSLTTRRGILSRTPKLFESVRAMQVIGAGEEGMNRDILTGSSEGFLHIAGKATMYKGNWLFISEITYKDDGVDNNIIPQVGDLIRFHIGTGSVIGATQVQEAHISLILSASLDKFLFLLDTSINVSSPVQGKFALFKPGNISISNIPGGIASGIEVPSNAVHLGGHTDVFIRPNSDVELQGVLDNITDGSPLFALIDVTIPTANQNIVTSVSMGTSIDKISIGDLMVIETGTGFAGSYKILEIGDPDSNSVRVDSIFTSSTVGPLRARVVHSITVDLIEPKIPKLPFNTGSVSDLTTTVGSTLFRLDTTDIQSFGAVVGDVIRVLDGPDASDFVIIAFDTGLGGQGPIVDRPASTTLTSIRYEIFTALNGLTLPLVRVKALEVLDSTKQGTGIKIPYGDAVDIRPTCDFEGAGRAVSTLDKQLLILPDLLGIWGNSQTSPFGSLLADQRPSTVAGGTDARFTQKLEIADGIVRRLTALGGNDITTLEINIPPYVWNGRRDTFLAFTTYKDLDFTGATGEHKTSDIAKSNVGDTLTIIDGPNKGNYIIKDKRVLELWGKTDLGHRNVAIVQVDPEFPVDPLRTAMDFIAAVGTPLTATNLLGILDYATDWDAPAGWYMTTFIPTLRTNLAAQGVVFASDTDLKNFFDPLIKSGYTVGPAARGDLRLYFQEPVSVEFNSGDDPTTFVSSTDSSKVFRLSIDTPPAQIFPESSTDTPPTQWNRNLGLSAVPFNTSVYLTDNGSLPLKGIRVGDVVQFHAAIDDLLSRTDMSSSWLVVTQAGSNVVQLILPPQAELDNFSLLTPGQLLFIDSGPDIGAYVVTAIEQQTWPSSPSLTPPTIKVRLDKPLTFTTLDYPISANLDFSSALLPRLESDVITFPSGATAGKTLSILISHDSGATFVPSLSGFTFSAGSYTDIASIVSAIPTSSDYSVFADGNRLVFKATGGSDFQKRAISIQGTFVSSILSLNLFQSNGIRGACAFPGTKRIYGAGLTGFQSGEYITTYAAAVSPDFVAEDVAYLGTFKITSLGTETTGPYIGEAFVDLDRTDPFPTSTFATVVGIRWIHHIEAPATAPAVTSLGGTELSSQFVRFRLYEDIVRELTVDNIPWSSLDGHPLSPSSQTQLELSGSLAPNNKNFAYKVPYRILRKHISRTSSTAMAKNREGALYFLDLPVIGYGPGAEMNVTTNQGFLLAGTFNIEGYTLKVDDENFTFSTKESVSIILPNAVLPVGSTPEQDSEFNLAGQNIQISYNNAPLVEDIQRFFDSPLDRVLVANILARHFLPSYVFLDINYAGGSSEELIAVDLINYINTVDPNDNQIRVDRILKIFERKNASTVTLPITLISLTHGVDRRIRGMRSKDSIGGDNLPFFKGTFAQTYFISGPDTSNEPTRQDGEQVFLVRS